MSVSAIGSHFYLNVNNLIYWVFNYVKSERLTKNQVPTGIITM